MKNTEKLAGKIALITGGNSGIGLATAKLFHEQGAKVVITARSPETFKKAQAEYGSIFDVVQTDVSDLAALDRLYAHIKQKHGGLDVIFANAGVAYFAPTEQTDANFFDSQFNPNVRGLYFTVAKALPLLRDGASVILNSSSLNAKGSAGAAIYAATKAAVRSFARSWTAEFLPSKVRFNVLSPGPIETPIFAKTGMSPEQLQGFAEQVKADLPAKRFGKPEEMAAAALFLASSDSSFLCGSDLAADGGFAQV